MYLFQNIYMTFGSVFYVSDGASGFDRVVACVWFVCADGGVLIRAESCTYTTSPPIFIKNT